MHTQVDYVQRICPNKQYIKSASTIGGGGGGNYDSVPEEVTKTAPSGDRLNTLNLIRLIRKSAYYTSYRLEKAPKVGTETRSFARPQLHAQASPDRHQRLILTAIGLPCQRCNCHIFWWKNGGDIAAESEPFDMRRVNQDRLRAAWKALRSFAEGRACEGLSPTSTQILFLSR